MAPRRVSAPLAGLPACSVRRAPTGAGELDIRRTEVMASHHDDPCVCASTWVQPRVHGGRAGRPKGGERRKGRPDPTVLRHRNPLGFGLTGMYGPAGGSNIGPQTDASLHSPAQREATTRRARAQVPARTTSRNYAGTTWARPLSVFTALTVVEESGFSHGCDPLAFPAETRRPPAASA
jgi:hypothetical protein